MQNLTVVPGKIDGKAWVVKPNTYTVIIGHRRLAASKAAGLTEVPCRVIEDMTHKEMVSMMLEENMQRNDLTIVEQAQGFQMMLDLGSTEAEIADKTGLSKTTVHHRLELAKLDRKYKVQSALKQKERDENFEELFGQVKIYGVKQNTKISVYSNGYEVLQSINLNKLPESFDFKKQDPTKCILTRDNYNGYNAYIVIKKSDMPKEKVVLSAEEIKRRRVEANHKIADEKLKALKGKLLGMLIRVVNEDLKPNEMPEDEIAHTALCMSLKGKGYITGRDIIAYYEGRKYWEIDFEDMDSYNSFSVMQLALMQLLATQQDDTPFEWNMAYRESEANELLKICDLMSQFGFSPTEDEIRLLAGTHELYEREEK